MSNERKYFGSGRSSAMSDNEHSFPTLGHAEILAVAHLPLHVVPQVMKRREDRAEGPLLIVSKQSCDVFKEKQVRSFGVGDPAKIEEQSSASVLESSSASGD